MSTTKGVIAAGHPITVEAAAEMLLDGGNAFDAALAGLLASCVPEVVLSSIGGGGFLMAQPANAREPVLYDFFAQTPSVMRPEGELDFYAINADFGPATQEFHIGAGASAVPGLIQGLFRVHADHCTLPMTRIVEPAVRAASEGVEMSPFHAYLFTIVEPILTASDAAKACFAPEGALLKGSETYRNPAFAETLDGLAREGHRLFTEGEIARAIAAQSDEFGGHLTMADLKAYTVEVRAPIIWRHRGAEIALNPAPAASGALIAFALALLEGLSPEGSPGALELARVMAETNTARDAQNADIAALTASGVIDRHLQALSNHTRVSRGTTHISVIDADGNAASASVSNGEGNGKMVGEFGFMLNNMLGEEDLNSGDFHRWAPDTRLSSMMAPSLIRETGGAITALGSGGSNRIRSAVLQVALNLIDRGLDLQQSVAAPRMHVEKSGKLSFEEGPWGDLYAEEELHQLAEVFEDIEHWPERNVFFGGVHAARALRGGFEGAGDPRREGEARIIS